MDAAKGCNFVLTNGGRMSDFWGIGKAAVNAPSYCDTNHCRHG